MSSSVTSLSLQTVEDVSAWLRGKFQTAKKRLAGYWWWNLIFCSAAAEKWLSEAALADKRVALPTASGSVFGVWSARREATGVPLLTVCVLFWWEETGGDVYQPHTRAHTHTHTWCNSHSSCGRFWDVCMVVCLCSVTFNLHLRLFMYVLYLCGFWGQCEHSSAHSY